MKLLIINPGSTSTKISLYEDKKSLFEESVFHDAPELLKYKNVNDQVPFRKQVILDLLKKYNYSINDVDVFVGRGGSAYPQRQGVTVIDELLYNDTLNGVGGSEHPAKLGVVMAYEFSKEFNKPAYTLNPTNVDELCDEARVTGIKGLYRNAQSHVLNQKAIAKYHSKLHNKKYAESNYIVSHIDGGITINAHKNGLMVDGNVGSGGDGPFSPTRIGTVPILPLLDFIEEKGIDEVRLMCSRKGGFVSFFDTSNADKVYELVKQNDPKATLVWNSMIYEICKSIGSMSCVLDGKVDGILLTGGLCRFEDIINTIKKKCEWIAPIYVYPGELEQDELAFSVIDALEGKQEINHYTGKPVFEGFKFID